MTLKMMAAASLIALAGCGGGGGGGTAGPTPPATPVRSVGGDYTMVVALGENGCGVVTVQPLPTRVTHTPGASQFQLTHGPGNYTGTFDEPTGGAFRTQAVTFADATTSQTVHIQGRFTGSGLEAVVTVDQSAPAPACRYLVNWTGTKVGAPNVIP
jgi:hypothetical protein